MIKLGSRTELILPRDAVRVEVAVGADGPGGQHGAGAAGRLVLTSWPSLR